MSLRWRVVTIAVVTAIVGGWLGVAVAGAVRESNRAVHSLTGRWGPATTDVNALLAHLVDQETGERGYLLTGDRKYLEPYDEGQQEAADDVATLRLLMAGDSVGEQRLAAVEASITAWRTQAARPEISARGQSASQGMRLVATGQGKRLFDALRRDVSALQTFIEQRRNADRQHVADANHDLTVWLWLNLVVSILVGVGVLAGLVMWVLRPIARLEIALRRVAGGDLKAPVGVGGPAEIAAVSESADAMRRRLLDELERSETALQALEQRGPVVVALSQHLLPRSTGPVPGLRYAATLRPAEGLLAGDWVDVLPLSRDRVALMLLDVSGHGAAAGLEAMRLKSVLTTSLALGRQPHEALAQAAAGFTEDERFATAVIVVLDTVSGELRWANAGHLAPRLVPLETPTVTTDDMDMLRPTGPILSSITSGWTTSVGHLAVGQMLLSFSDGLTEARDESGREFGVDGIARALSETTVRDVDTAVSVCLAAVRAHSVNVHRDDITLLAVTRDPSTVLPAGVAAGDLSRRV